MQKVTMRTALLAAAVCLAAAPARAAIKLAPGTWQQVETGSEDGKPAAPETYTDCLTPAQASDPVKALSALEAIGGLIGQRCKSLQVHEGDNTISVEFACGDEKWNFIGVSLNFTFLDPRHYTGTIKSTFLLKGEKTTTDKTIEAKWLGPECKKL